jgi:hypothetical protein
MFFKQAEERSSLPGNSAVNVVDSFLASLVSVVSINPDYKLSIRAIAILFNYLKNDPQVFKRFKPNKMIIKNMNLAQFILCKSI